VSWTLGTLAGGASGSVTVNVTLGAGLQQQLAGQHGLDQCHGTTIRR
jgi:L-lactate permease